MGFVFFSGCVGLSLKAGVLAELFLLFFLDVASQGPPLRLHSTAVLEVVLKHGQTAQPPSLFPSVCGLGVRSACRPCSGLPRLSVLRLVGHLHVHTGSVIARAVGGDVLSPCCLPAEGHGSGWLDRLLLDRLSEGSRSKSGSPSGRSSEAAGFHSLSALVQPAVSRERVGAAWIGRPRLVLFSPDLDRAHERRPAVCREPLVTFWRAAVIVDESFVQLGGCS